jgi:hypothetical protein
MKHKHFSLLILILLLVPLLSPSATYAQRGARLSPPVQAMGARRSSNMIRPAPVRISRQGALRAANGIFTNGFSTNTLGGATFSPLSGLGIDGITINTVPGQSIGIQAAINPATQLQVAFAERVARITRGIFPGGGSYLLGGGGGYVIPAETTDNGQAVQPQQPQVIVVQQGPAQQGAPQVNADPVPSSPLADVGQFTLVLRDGKQIEAIAFTRVKDSIVFITSDGGRRTIASSDLDADATVRVNQERGTRLQLPI